MSTNNTKHNNESKDEDIIIESKEEPFIIESENHLKQTSDDYIFAQNLQKEINNFNVSKSVNDNINNLNNEFEKLLNNIKKKKQLDQTITYQTLNENLCLINNKLEHAINYLIEDNYGNVQYNNIQYNNIIQYNNFHDENFQDDPIISEVIEKSIIEYQISQDLNHKCNQNLLNIIDPIINENCLDDNLNNYDQDKDLQEAIEKSKKEININSCYLPENFKLLLFEDNFSKLTEQIHDYTSIELKLTILRRFRFKFKFIHNYNNTLIILPTFEEWLYTLKNKVCILSDYEFYRIENNKSLKLYLTNILNKLNEKKIIINGHIDSDYMDFLLEFQDNNELMHF